VEGQGNQVAAIAAADFQDAAIGDGRGLHAEEPGDGGETVGMRLAAGIRVIGNLIIEVVPHKKKPNIRRVGIKLAVGGKRWRS